MRSIWQIISSLILVTVFMALAVFSLVEYRGDNINSNSADDKLPLAKVTLANVSNLLAYLEQMPMIRLLPAAALSGTYESGMDNIVDLNQVSLIINNSNIKKKTDNLRLEATDSLSGNINLSVLWKRVKKQLSKDWSRP